MNREYDFLINTINREREVATVMIYKNSYLNLIVNIKSLGKIISQIKIKKS